MTKLTMKPLVAAAALLGMAFSASAFAAECNTRTLRRIMLVLFTLLSIAQVATPLLRNT